MTFNSFEFLFVFLPIILITFWMLRTAGKNSLSLWLIVLASLLLYGIYYPCGLIVFLFSLAVNFGVMKCSKKYMLILGIIFDVFLLAVFKYGGYFFDVIGTQITAPGISFYTFGEIALLVELYRQNINVLSAREYMFIHTYFPKIIQGPITRPSDLLIQIDTIKKPDAESVFRGMMLFALGCFKKVIIADTLGGAVDYGFGNLNAMHTGEALVIMVSYTLQLYFDFSGYCDMAMAISSFLGIELPLNFNAPYKAKNIEDFWKRWHISLTGFFTRYLYIPLGGNRKGKTRMYVNFLIIFFVSGIWHGAGWQFVIWGLMHGILYVLHRLYSNHIKDKDTKLRNHYVQKAVSALKIGLTFLYVNAAWVFFRAPSVDDALHLFKDMGELWLPRFNIYLANCFNIDELWYVIKMAGLDQMWWSPYILMVLIIALLLILVFFGRTAVEYAKTCKISIWNSLLIAVLMIWCIVSFNNVATYLYVNF